MKRLSKIIFQFPSNNNEEIHFYKNMSDILGILPNIKKTNNKVTLFSTFPVVIVGLLLL